MLLECSRLRNDREFIRLKWRKLVVIMETWLDKEGLEKVRGRLTSDERDKATNIGNNTRSWGTNTRREVEDSEGVCEQRCAGYIWKGNRRIARK